MSAGGDKPQKISTERTDTFPIPVFSNGLENEGLYGFADTAKIFEESITVSARGTIGYVCLRQEPYVPIVRLVSLTPYTNIVSSKYLYLWVCNLQISSTGTSQQQLTVPNFKNTPILIPDNSTMQTFTEIVNPMFETIKHNKEQNIHLATLRDSLLPRLLSGELDISEIDI